MYFVSKSTIKDEEVFTIDNYQTYVPVLDDKISMHEIHEAAKRLKENKSSADGWIPHHQMINGES